MDDLPSKEDKRQALAAELRKLNELLDAGKADEAKEQARLALPHAAIVMARKDGMDLYRKLKDYASQGYQS